jgi:hypothetical protein
MTQPKSRPFSIKIYLPDGTPEGLRIVERSNWTGCGVVCPRAVFAEAKKRDEFEKMGVYVLVGPPEDEGLPTIYVGQADSIRSRLESHHAEKDFWTWAVFFVAKDEGINRAHTLYLESRLVELAQDAKRALLDNKTTPPLPKLSEAEAADMESFLADILNILPLVGLSVFESPKTSHTKKNTLYLSGKGVKATGCEVSEGFVVLKGSTSSMKEAPSLWGGARAMREKLIERGVLEVNGDKAVFTQDYTFNSPTIATEVVLATHQSGPQSWVDSKGKTLKELREESAK